MLNAETKKKVEVILEQVAAIQNIEISKVTLDISDPPCSKCKHWNPHVVVKKRFDGTYEVGATTMCTVMYDEDSPMYSDFSCFDEKND